jgi:uncharacterized oligopeptide transporter (OPT) family protein
VKKIDTIAPILGAIAGLISGSLLMIHGLDPLLSLALSFLVWIATWDIVICIDLLWFKEKDIKK